MRACATGQVDLTKAVEAHRFTFDAFFNEADGNGAISYQQLMVGLYPDKSFANISPEELHELEEVVATPTPALASTPVSTPLGAVPSLAAILGDGAEAQQGPHVVEGDAAEEPCPIPRSREVGAEACATTLFEGGELLGRQAGGHKLRHPLFRWAGDAGHPLKRGTP